MLIERGMGCTCTEQEQTRKKDEEGKAQDKKEKQVHVKLFSQKAHGGLEGWDVRPKRNKTLKKIK